MHQYRQGHARARRAGRAHRRGRVARARRRRRRLSQPAGRARLRQFRHRLPAGDGRGRGLPDHRDLRRRRALRKRPMQRILDPVSAMGARAVSASEGGRLPLTLAGARDPIPIVYRTPGAVGADQVGGAAGRPRGARRHGGDRERGEPRPHRAPARAFRRRRSRSSRRATHGRRITLTGEPELVAGAGRGAGRSVFGGVSDGGGAARAGLGDHPRPT